MSIIGYTICDPCGNFDVRDLYTLERARGIVHEQNLGRVDYGDGEGLFSFGAVYEDGSVSFKVA